MDATFLQWAQWAYELVKERIPGNRTGQDVPNYQHSWSVCRILKDSCFDYETSLAGLLHDIVEDGDVSYRELESLGCSRRVLELVRLVSHEETVHSYEARQVLMFAALIKAADAGAWAIKIADTLDNVLSSSSLDLQDRMLYVEVHARLLLELTRPFYARHRLWRNLRDATDAARLNIRSP